MDVPRIVAAHLAASTELSEPRLSPDGSFVAYATSGPGGPALVVQPVSGAPARRTTTADPPPRVGRADGGGCFAWTPDGAALVHAAGDGGLWRTALAGGPSVQVVAALDGAPAQAPAVSPDGAHVAYVTDTREVRVASLASPGEPAVVLSDAAFAVDPVWHPGGRRVGWHEWDPPHMPWDHSRLAAAGPDGTARATLRDVDQVQQPRWSPDGRHLAFLADEGGWLRLWVADAAGRSARPVLPAGAECGGPTWGHGQRSFAWSPDGATIAFARNEGGFGRLCTVGIHSGHVEAHARGWHSGLDWRGEVLVAVRSGARTPTQLAAYDTRGWARRVLAVGPHAAFDDPTAPEPEPVAWTAADGTTVPGRLYRPPSPSGRLIVWVHGGPTGQWPVTFWPRAAYWLARGWSILVPDHRGSTGHGRDFTQALRERWGELDVQDVADGVRAAYEQGWGRPGATVAMGGSAGGFTVAHLLARFPGLVAAAVVSYPVTDLLRLDETTHRFEAHYNQGLVGPRPAADERYRERSPIAHAHRVRDPLLVLHGDADEVVGVDQAQAFVTAARGAGAPVELVVYPGEGHGFRGAATVADELGRTEAFLHAHTH